MISRFKGELVLLDSNRGEEGGTEPSSGFSRDRPPASRPTTGAAPKSGPSWDAPKGGDLDDEIPF